MDKNNITSHYLEERVDRAIENAMFSEYDPKLKTVKEVINQSIKTKARFDVVGMNDYLDCGEFQEDESHKVSVDNPDDYLTLLNIAYLRWGEITGNNPEDVKKMAQESYDHELEHASSGLSHAGLQVRYVVEFFKYETDGAGIDNGTIYIGGPKKDVPLNGLVIGPGISLYGKVQKKVLLKMVNSASELSEVDKILGQKDNFMQKFQHVVTRFFNGLKPYQNS